MQQLFQLMGEKNMDEKQLFEQRKHMVLALMQDKTYVPMKQKELAIVMQVAREEPGKHWCRCWMPFWQTGRSKFPKEENTRLPRA